MFSGLKNSQVEWISLDRVGSLLYIARLESDIRTHAPSPADEWHHEILNEVRFTGPLPLEQPNRVLHDCLWRREISCRQFSPASSKGCSSTATWPSTFRRTLAREYHHPDPARSLPECLRFVCSDVCPHMMAWRFYLGHPQSPIRKRNSGKHRGNRDVPTIFSEVLALCQGPYEGHEKRSVFCAEGRSPEASGSLGYDPNLGSRFQ